MPLIERRAFVRNLLGVAVAGNLAPASAAVPDRAPGDGPEAPRPALAMDAPSRDRIDIFEVMTPQQVAAVKRGESRDDTPAFAEALRLAAEVTVPAGVFHVADVRLPGGRRIKGTGAGSVIRLVPGAPVPRLFSAVDVEAVGLAGLMLDGAGAATFGAAFTAVRALELRDLGLTGVDGYGLLLDGCSDARLESISFSNTGKLGGYAALGMVDWTRRGQRNVARGIKGDRVKGRLVALFGQDNGTVENVLHTNVILGEAVYFFDCRQCSMDRIRHIGGGVGMSGEPNPGNDGCAIAGASRYCSANNGLTVDSSGHSISISGSKGMAGPSYNKVTNWTAKNPDEGGVVITDQGAAGAAPAHNVVQDCTVLNPGARIPESAFSCFGGNDNRFINCSAEDDRPVKRMNYAFEEGDGANGAAANSWTGVQRGGTRKARFRLISPRSSATIRA